MLGPLLGKDPLWLDSCNWPLNLHILVGCLWNLLNVPPPVPNTWQPIWFYLLVWKENKQWVSNLYCLSPRRNYLTKEIETIEQQLEAKVSFTVKLRKPWTAKKFQECWLCSDQSQWSSGHASQPQNHKLTTVAFSGLLVSHTLLAFSLQHNNIPWILLIFMVLWVSQ